MSGTNRRGKPQPVMSWTRFRLPLNEPLPNLDDESDEDPRGWKKYLGPLDEAEGRRSSTEAHRPIVPKTQPDLNSADLEAFTASPGYATYLEGLGLADKSTPPYITIISSMYPWHLRGRVTIYSLSFTHPATEKRKMLESLVGIYPTFGSVPGNMHNSPNRALRAQKGWVKEPQVLWKSPEAEKELENQDPLSFERWRISPAAQDIPISATSRSPSTKVPDTTLHIPHRPTQTFIVTGYSSQEVVVS
ncbi:hypothetical protein M432DRAFT_593548 [Thermoascus aurantiacus ATCC 26904]